MAIARGSFENSTTVLVSATPSLESLFNAKEKKNTIISIYLIELDQLGCHILRQ